MAFLIFTPTNISILWIDYEMTEEKESIRVFTAEIEVLGDSQLQSMIMLKACSAWLYDKLI